MKKIYLLFTLITAGSYLFGQGINSQSRSAVKKISNSAIAPAISNSQAAGDTLFFAGFPGYAINPADASGFTFVTVDVDMKAVAPDYATEGITSEWILFEDSPGNNVTDTNKYLGATSWFEVPGVASNWIMFGPITIPVNGATLSWDHAFNPEWRDGYRVLLSNTGMSATDFTSPPIYTVTDLVNTNSTGIDTSFTKKSVQIPSSYNGTDVYIAFHHNANDQDFLYLDNLLLVEGLSVSVKDQLKNFNIKQNTPNPFTGSTAIQLEFEEAAENVIFNVYDITGKVVYTEYLGNRAPGKYNFQVKDLTIKSGIYFYTIVSEGSTSAPKRMVKQ